MVDFGGDSFGDEERLQAFFWFSPLVVCAGDVKPDASGAFGDSH